MTPAAAPRDPLRPAACRLVAMLLAGLVALPLLAPPEAEAAKRKRTACERLRGDDLAPARRLKVVRRERDGSVRILACTLRGGSVRTIASFTPQVEFESGDIEVVATGDRHALLLETHAERGHGSELVRVDTRTRRRHVITSRTCDPSHLCTGEVAGATALHRSGVLAVILSSQVVRVALDGGRTVLDEGPGVGALEVRGDAFAWTRDGRQHTAPVS